MDPPADRRFSLEELAALSGLPPRTVRYYMQVGLVDRPLGVRRGAWYEHRHLEQLLAVRRWQQAGLSLERIRQLAADSVAGGEPPPPPRRAGSVEVWSHIVLDEGVELLVEPGRAGLTPAALRALARECVATLERIRSAEEEA
jgi:DNA-binding transcriptional MerR regulator